MSKREDVIIKNADMESEMQNAAVNVAEEAFEKYNIEKDVASHIKKEFDKRYLPNWHCIVGKHFGSYVTHEANHFIYMYLGNTAVLLFKTG